jgi:hypothetical protein
MERKYDFPVSRKQIFTTNKTTSHYDSLHHGSTTLESYSTALTCWLGHLTPTGHALQCLSTRLSLHTLPLTSVYICGPRIKHCSHVEEWKILPSLCFWSCPCCQEWLWTGPHSSNFLGIIKNQDVCSICFWTQDVRFFKDLSYYDLLWCTTQKT